MRKRGSKNVMMELFMSKGQARLPIIKQGGQAAPLLILITCIVLVCLIVVVNVGKVSLNRASTENAADAGALAAASWLASGQNFIVRSSDQMYAASADFIEDMEAAGDSRAFHSEAEINAAVNEFNASMQGWFDAIVEAGAMACGLANDQGRAYAFYNVGVDEYKEPEDGESYQAYLRRDSRFSEWLQDEEYKAGLGEKSVYPWEDIKFEYWDSRTKEWVNYKPDRANEVAVVVGEAPESFVLTPGTLSGTTKWWEEVAEDCNCEWVCDENEENCGYECETCYEWVSHDVDFTVDPAFVARMDPEHAVVAVTTTRTEPDPDLGLWRLDIPDIESGARAGTFNDDGFYNCCLIDAW